MRIINNPLSVDAQRNLAMNEMSLSKSVERLSSGLRINRAADDAAGLSISERMRGQIRGLDQAGRNAQDGISMIQTGEGALNETHSILQRMRELAVQASNDTLGQSDRASIASELNALTTEIDRIANTTQFNGKVLLNGGVGTSVAAGSGTKVGTSLAGTSSAVVAQIDVSGAQASSTYTFTNAGNQLTLTLGTSSQTITVQNMTAPGNQVLNFTQLGVKLTVAATGGANDTGALIAAGLTTAGNVTTGAAAGATLQIGANSGQTMNVSIVSANANKIGAGGGFTDLANAVSSFAGAIGAANASSVAQNLISSVDQAVDDVSTSRSNLGAYQNRLEHTVANLAVASENLTASESRVRDADMAKEMAGFSRAQILNQAGTAILAQANQVPQGVLSLLR